MKLIKELNEDIELVSETINEATGEKSHYIKGVFMQSNVKNRNGRVYPREVLQREAERYMTENVEKRRAYGELGHPDSPTINLDRVSHMITKLKPDGDNIYGEAKIMDTPNGRIVKELMKEGASLGVSSRGMGSLKSKNGVNEVQNDFYLATPADIVADPSAPDAFVDGIMENVEWFFDEQRGWRAVEATDNIRKKAHNMSMRELEENRLKIFKQFMRTLKG